VGIVTKSSGVVTGLDRFLLLACVRKFTSGCCRSPSIAVKVVKVVQNVKLVRDVKIAHQTYQDRYSNPTKLDSLTR
jgi:hypothetical protein